MRNKTIAMCLLALAVVAGNAFAVGEARLTGKITDAVTKAPLPSATITLVSTGGRNFKGDYKAEKDGQYRILVLDGTLTYQVTYAAPGYQPYVETMKLRLLNASHSAFAYLGFLAGPAMIGAVSGASSLRGGFVFLCAVAVLVAACAPLLRESPA